MSEIEMDYKIRYAQELLWHFNCDRCQGWWTVADFQLSGQTFILCAHCGLIVSRSDLRTLPPVKLTREQEIERATRGRYNRLWQGSVVWLKIGFGIAVGMTAGWMLGSMLFRALGN